MAVINSYSTLTTAVADYLARSDLTSFIPNFVQNAESKLYRTLNLRNEETAIDTTITSGLAAVPSDFKALKFAYFDATPTRLLQWLPVAELYRDYPDRSDSDSPCVISREGSNFLFGPVSIDGTLKGIYYAKNDALGTSNETNWYTSNAPDVLLYGSLLEATPFIQNDERLLVWREFFTDSVNTLLEEEGNSAVSKGQLLQRVS